MILNGILDKKNEHRIVLGKPKSTIQSIMYDKNRENTEELCLYRKGILGI